MDKTTATTSLSLRSLTKPLASQWGVLALLIAVWTLEIYWLQSFTLISESGWKAADYSQAVAFRLTITILFCTGLTLLLPRLALVPCFIILLLFTQGAWFYHQYFEQALSWTTIRTLFMEGSDSIKIDKAFIIPAVLTTSTLLLLVKLALLWGTGKWPPRSRPRYAMGTLALSGYIALILLFNAMGNTPLKSMRNWMSFDRVAVAHGYIVTWVGEAIHVNNDTLLKNALAARQVTSDQITPIEGSLDLPGHLVLLQVESLDWHVLGLERQGREITPRLNALREQSMFFKVQAVHKNGSADADFVMLHACHPGNGVVTYKIAGYPHADSLPRIAMQAGLPMTVLHGNKARFYSRIDAFRQMDFQQTIFVKQMIEDYTLEPKKWGAVPDREVMMLSADLLEQAASPQSHLIITYTSHTPFVMLPDTVTPMLDNPGDTVDTRYLNSIHYVDQAIGEYLDRLPKGTTVVIYADHESAAGYPERLRPSGTPEYIPTFVYRVGEDLSQRQVSRDLPEPQSGQWTLIDVAAWVRHWLEAKVQAQGQDADQD